MKKFTGFEHGMGIGGWLTNYKRFNVLPRNRRLMLIVAEEAQGIYREEIFRYIDNFIGWCKKHGLNVVLNLHKAVGNYCDIQEEVELLDDESLQQRFIGLWIAFEKRYAGDRF